MPNSKPETRDPKLSPADALLVDRVRQRDEAAWNELIGRFEGRLLAFVESRLRNRQASEDVVQETFVGFLTSLPNYDSSRPLEGYLFSIAAHKLTDVLRREGRRPTLPLSAGSSADSGWELRGTVREASSIFRSGERRDLEETALAAAISEQIARWKETGQWQRLQCLELLLVRGWSNQAVARHLQISEQAVANQKFEFISRLRASVSRQRLPKDVFPELYD